MISNILRIFVFLLILNCIFSLPLRQWVEDYNDLVSADNEMPGFVGFAPFEKRNIAIGRGDGLRPGK